MSNDRQIAEIKIADIDWGSNIRSWISEESVRGLAQTIEKRGVEEPVTVKPNGSRFLLIKGFRRLMASKVAGRTTIPALIDEREQSTPDILIAQATENLQRENLSELEQARAIEQILIQTGWSAAQVAAELGLPKSQVSKLRSLLSLPVSIQERIATGEIPASTAFEIARADTADIQTQLATEAIQGGLSRDAVAGKVRSAKRQSPSTSNHASARVTAIVDSQRSVAVTCPNLNLDSFIETIEVLLTKARRARPKGLELSTFVKMLRDQAKRNSTEAA